MSIKGVFRRRKYFIKKKLQFRFVFGFSLTVIIGFLTSWTLVYYMVDKRLSEALYRSHIKIDTTGELISNILLKINLIVIPSLILVVIIVGLIIVRNATNPILGLKEAFEALEHGDLTPKTLRKEVPGELAASFHAMTNNLSNTFASLKEKEADLEQTLTRLRKAADNSKISQNEVKTIYKSILEQREFIDQKLSFFKI